MAKQRMKLSVKIPNFDKDAGKWRRAIHDAVIEGQKQGARRIKYLASDKLDVQIRLHLRGYKLGILDVDNRAKTILDALQGLMLGKSGKKRESNALIPNDKQIYRLVIEKRLPPKADKKAFSTIVIRKYRNHRGTANRPISTHKHPTLVEYK